MPKLNLAERFGRAQTNVLGGAAVSLVGAVLLYTRYGIHQELSRDESIYTYASQQLAHGHAPYTSIFDPKGPGATLVGGLGAALARLFGANDIYGIRLIYFVVSCLTVVAVYLLAQHVSRSVVGGVAAAAVFAAFIVFARDALGGPDAKTPGILAAVLSMWWLARRSWFLAGVAAGCAVLVWQPLLIYPAVAIVLPLVVADVGARRVAAVRALAGVALPVVLVGLYLAVTGALGRAIEAGFLFPLTGIQKPPFSLMRSLRHIRRVITFNYGTASSWLLALGIFALLACAVVLLVRAWRRKALLSGVRDPVISVVLVTGLFELAYPIYDFQGGPDTIPFTPYAALGVAVLVGLVLEVAAAPVARRIVTVGAAVFALLVSAHGWRQFDRDRHNDALLKVQMHDGCAVGRLADGGRIWALGDPTILAVTHRRNPDRFIYLGEQVGLWKVKHTTGGFDGWTRQIARVAPPVIVMQTWHTDMARRMGDWLRSAGYVSRYVGQYHVLVTPSASARAQQLGVRLTPRPTAKLETTSGDRARLGCSG